MNAIRANQEKVEFYWWNTCLLSFTLCFVLNLLFMLSYYFLQWTSLEVLCFTNCPCIWVSAPSRPHLSWSETRKHTYRHTWISQSKCLHSLSAAALSGCLRQFCLAVRGSWRTGFCGMFAYLLLLTNVQAGSMHVSFVSCLVIIILSVCLRLPVYIFSCSAHTYYCTLLLCACWLHIISPYAWCQNCTTAINSCMFAACGCSLFCT